MKRIPAILLVLALMLSLAACGDSAAPAPTAAPVEVQPAASEQPAPPAETAAPTEAPQEETERFPTFTAEQAEEYYQAIMDGEVTGPLADVIKAQEPYTAKLYLDLLTNVFHDDLLGGISSCSGQEMDMIMAEVAYMAREYLEQEQAQSAPPEDVNYDQMGNTMTLYSPVLHRSVRIKLNENEAFMEPDWAMMTDQPENFFLHIGSNYELFTLQYGALTASTEELIDGWVQRHESQGRDVAVSEVQFFNAGGFLWEILTISYEQVSTGIDKDTNQEVTLTSTVYDTTCFVRLDDESALQLVTGISVDPDIMEFYKNVVCTSITEIVAEKGTAADVGVG